MTPVPPARHLLRAKDLIDRRYRDPLDVETLAEAAHLSRAHFSREFRRAFGEPPHQYLLTRRMERAAALLRNDRSLGGRDLPDRRAAQRRLVHDELRAHVGLSPTAYRAAYPPAADLARVPTCVLRAWARPQSSTFREDRRARTRD